MTQFDYGTIDPAETSGADLAVKLGTFRDALYSSHKGPTEPPYKRAGLMWVKDDVSPWQWRFCTGSNWATIATINPATHALQLYHGGIPLGLLATKNTLNGTEMDDGFLEARHVPTGLLTPNMFANGPLGHTFRFNPTTGALETTPMTGLGMVLQVFTTSGTYTPSPGMRFCISELLGAGASGARMISTATSSNIDLATGGGGGGYSKRLLTQAQIGASQTVTIGNGGAAKTANGSGNNGGTTSLGSLHSATGGFGGAADTAPAAFNGGNGGNGVGGDINMRGGPGCPLFIYNSGPEAGSPGGRSIFGGEGNGNGGSAQVNSGSGGGGSVTGNSGAGANGICIITDFL